MSNKPNKNLPKQLFARMVATAARIAGHDQGEDCAQEAVARMIHADCYDPDAPLFDRLAVRVTRNVALNYIAASGNRGHYSATASDDDGNADDLVDTLTGADGRTTVMRRENEALLLAGLELLADDEAEFIRLLLSGHGQRDAGEMVGWSNSKASVKREQIAEKLAKVCQ